MQENSVSFTFGSVQDTQIVHYDSQVLLPYNPFCFDIVESLQGIGTKAVFGRKSQLSQIILKAPTISAKHFSIGEDQKLYDNGSNKGTFKWIFKDTPKYLQQGDVLLIGKTEFTITLIDLQNSQVRIKNQDTKQHIMIKKSKYTIGSHHSCHHILKDLLGYHVLIDPKQARIISMVEDEDISIQKGVWERLSPSRIESKGKDITQGDFIMAFPYIFKVQF